MYSVLITFANYYKTITEQHVLTMIHVIKCKIIGQFLMFVLYNVCNAWISLYDFDFNQNWSVIKRVIFHIILVVVCLIILITILVHSS